MRILRQIEIRPLEWLGLFLVAALVFVWPIRGTIALRNILLLTAIAIWLTTWIVSVGAKPRLDALKAPLLWYGALTAWLLAGAFLVSVDTQWSLLELKSQWLRSTLAGFLGFLVAGWAVRPRINPTRVALGVLLLVVPFALQILLTLADTVWLWVSQGYLPERIARLTGGKLGMSVNVNFLFALIAADVLVRAKKPGALLPLTPLPLLALGAAALACTYVIGARNGTLCLVVLVLAALCIHFAGRRCAPREVAGIVGIAIVLAGVSYASFKSDYRWQAFEESAALAWDTDANRAWLDQKAFPLPKLHNGKDVEVSTYLRIAWLKEGTMSLIDRPLGIGFGRDAMGRVFQEKYGQGVGGHADNGLIDFSLAAGLPGIVLGGGFLASLMLLGWRTYARQGAYIGLALLLTVITYAMRVLLDSITRDNYLEQFLFMSALFATLAAALLVQPRQVAAPA
jgi:hypothetical protein